VWGRNLKSKEQPERRNVCFEPHYLSSEELLTASTTVRTGMAQKHGSSSSTLGQVNLQQQSQLSLELVSQTDHHSAKKKLFSLTSDLPIMKPEGDHS